ncbi:cellulose biosynthesis protein BcsC [Phenylobacterium aquaticum]|uniref:cellulose biosynthesis protein BcsC n=1 Tax=Phenylobacterium aquaticum TaxID=1763816 RepID=UPI0026EE77F8|nr:cellulose biosynthesis protein BcsC [Phenylobacterium aquaticum]
MSVRTALPATAVAALASAIAAQAQAEPVVRLPDTGSSTADLPIRTAPPEVTADGHAQAVVSPVEALIRQAQAWRRQGRTDQAQATLQRALALSPNHPDVLYALADLARGRGDQMSAAVWAGRLSAVHPHDPRLAGLAKLDAPAQTSHALVPAAAAPAAPARTAQAPELKGASTHRTAVAATTDTPPVVRAAPPAPVKATDRNAELRTAGFNALQSGDLSEAEGLFQQALKAAPGDRDAAGGLGVVRLKQQRFAAARDLLTQASQGAGAASWKEARDAADFFADLQQASMARDAGKLAEAEARARKLTNRPQAYRIEAQLFLGDILASAHRSAEAEAAFRAALSLAPNRDEARMGLALALIDQNKADQAETLIHDIPDSAAARSLTGRIERARATRLTQAGDTFGAGSALASALNADPSDPWTRYDYAKFLAANGDRGQAAVVVAPLSAPDANVEALSAGALYAASQNRLTEAAALVRRIPESRRSKDIVALSRRLSTDGTIQEAKRLADQGLSTRAVILLRGQLANGGLDFGAQSRVAQALYDLGDTYQAGALALQAAQSPLPAGAHPGDAAGFVEVLGAAGQDEAAEQLLSTLQARAASADDQTAFTGLMTGYAIRKADRQRTGGDYAGAFDTLSAAFSAAPNDIGLMSALARLCQAGGLHAQATQVYDALVARQPNDVGVLLDATRAAIDAQDYPRAQARLQHALQLAPRKAELYFELGRMEKARGNDRAAEKAFRIAASLANGPAAAPVGPTGAPALFRAGGGLGPNPFGGARTSDSVASFGPGLSQGFGPAGFSQTAPTPMGLNFAPAAPTQGQAFSTAYVPPGAPTRSAPFQAAQFQGAQFQGAQFQGLTPQPAATPPRGVFSAAIAALTPSFLAPASTGFGGAPMALPANTPLNQQINQELSALEEDHAIAVQGDIEVRARSGDAGSSRMTEVTTGATISGPAFGGRLSASITPTALRAGTSAGLVSAEVGTGSLAVAAGKILSPPVQITAKSVQPAASGVGFDVGYKSEHFAGDVGVTPVGFGQTKVIGGVQWTPSLGATTLKFGLERRSVTDSVLSYAGMKDAYTGQTWGGVTRDQVTVGASYDRGHGVGAYAEGSMKRLTGHGVADNSAYEINLGGYVTAYQSEHSNLRLGVNVNTQAYDKNLRHFSLGQGGYFSPQQYVSLSFPVSYALSGDKWKWDVKIAPGFQSYSEDPSLVFPTNPALQGKLAAATIYSTEVQAFHQGNSRSGFGISGEAKAEYQISPSASIGGKASLDTFGQYNEFKLGVFLRKTFGGPQ